MTPGLAPEEVIKMVADLQAGIERFEELRRYHDMAVIIEGEYGLYVNRYESQRDEINKLRGELNETRIHAAFYNLLIQMIGENPTLQVIWDEMIMNMKLINPDLEQEFEHIRRTGGQ